VLFVLPFPTLCVQPTPTVVHSLLFLPFCKDTHSFVSAIYFFDPLFSTSRRNFTSSAKETRRGRLQLAQQENESRINNDPPTMRTSTFLSIAAALTSSVSATVYQGFNYGSTFTDGSAKNQSDFEAEFKSAKNLVGTSGAFTSARLYTMIVCSPLKARMANGGHNLIDSLFSKPTRYRIQFKQFPPPSLRRHLSFSEYGHLVDKQE
jgi:hypothetical protein